jgi:hypothetical protein
MQKNVKFLSLILTFIFFLQTEVHCIEIPLLTTDDDSLTIKNLQAQTNATYNSVVLSWSAIAEGEFHIIFRKTGSADWYDKASSRNYIILNGLDTSATYEWMVKITSDTADTLNGKFIQGPDFLTGSGICADPDSLYSISSKVNDHYQIDLRWNKIEGAAKYLVSYRSKNKSAWTNLTSTINNLTISRNPDTLGMEWFVKTICTDDNSVRSDFVSGPDLLSLREEHSDDQTLVYPMPVTDELTIVFPSSDHFITELFTAEGIKVASFKSSSGKHKMNTSGIPAGFYYLKISTPEGIIKIKRIQKT